MEVVFLIKSSLNLTPYYTFFTKKSLFFYKILPPINLKIFIKHFIINNLYLKSNNLIIFF